MTVSPQPVRAVARVSADRPEQSGPAILLPRRRPGHLGPFHITQLLLAEAVIVGVLVAATQNAVLAVAVGAVGALVLLLTLARQRGRWWLERQLMTRQYRRRRQQATAAVPGDDPRLVALRRLAPGLTVENIAVADGAQVGVARDDAGWYAVASVTPHPATREDRGGVPLDTLAAALAEADQPGVVLQVVTQTVPAPSMDAHPSSAAGQSYRQLLARFGTVPVPADQETWLAVRLDARALAESIATGIAGGADLDAAPAVVAALARRIAKSLRRDGVAHRLLDADALLAALARCCDLEPPAPGAEPAQQREDWSEWHSARLAHRSFWLRGWPPLAQAPAVLNWLATAPAALTNVALVLAPDEDNRMVDLRALVRVAAPAADLGPICQALVNGATQARAELFALDGEQGPAVYASAPTGGGAR